MGQRGPDSRSGPVDQELDAVGVLEMKEGAVSQGPGVQIRRTVLILVCARIPELSRRVAQRLRQKVLRIEHDIHVER